MTDSLIEAIFQAESETPEAEDQLRQLIRSNPALAKSLSDWYALHHDVAHKLDLMVPDRHLLVLYSIQQRGNASILTDEEKRYLAQHRAGIEQAIATYPSLHDVLKQIDASADMFDAVWEAESKRVFNKERYAADRIAVRGKRHQVLRTASTLFALLVVVLIVFFQTRLETVRTGPGEFTQVTLADQSTIRLMENSRLIYQKTDDGASFDRSVRLKGQAYFNISPNEKPFQIQTRTAITTATGTSFAIKAERSITEVVLTSGEVQLQTRRGTPHQVMLFPGQKSTVKRRRAPTQPEPVPNMVEALRWTGLLVFYRTPLSNVIDQLEANYGVTITLDPALGDEVIRFTIDPQIDTIDSVLEALAQATSSQFTMVDGTTYAIHF